MGWKGGSKESIRSTASKALLRRMVVPPHSRLIFGGTKGAGRFGHGRQFRRLGVKLQTADKGVPFSPGRDPGKTKRRPGNPERR
jgi:hypothetical protein